MPGGIVRGTSSIWRAPADGRDAAARLARPDAPPFHHVAVSRPRHHDHALRAGRARARVAIEAHGARHRDSRWQAMGPGLICIKAAPPPGGYPIFMVTAGGS